MSTIRLRSFESINGTVASRTGSSGIRCACALLVFAFAANSQSRATIDIQPAEALYDERVVIRVRGLEPDHDFVLRAVSTDQLKRTWLSQTPFRSGSDGTYDFSRGKSAEESMRPFWSMQLAPDTPRELVAPQRFVAPPAGSFLVRMEVLDGQNPVASAVSSRLVLSPRIRVTEVRENGLVGRLYEPETPGKRAAVVYLTGSTGGIAFRPATLLASRGYVAFALAYFRIDPLPHDLLEIPIEYFDRGITWLKQRQSVDASRLAVYGISKGGELSLLLASLRPQDWRAVVAVSPSSVVWEGGVRDPSKTGYDAIKPNRSSWSLDGKPMPFLQKVISSETKRRINSQGSVDTIEFYEPALADEPAVARARIPVERITAPVLLVASQADRMWPAAAMSRDVCAIIRNHAGSCDLLVYPNSSHMISEPWLPIPFGTFPALPGRWDKPSLGGSAEGSVHAAMDSWPKILEFLDRRLNK
jgi:dienelactone hydrolase